jgi:aspartate racemase
VIHIADAALAALGPKRAGRVMLLATPGTLRAGFYATRFASRSVTLETPAVDDQRAVNNAIAAVKAGETDAARATLLPILGRLANEGVELFLLGCTELPIAVRGTPFQAKSIDATDALALAIVAFSLNPDKP